MLWTVFAKGGIRKILAFSQKLIPSISVSNWAKETIYSLLTGPLPSSPHPNARAEDDIRHREQTLQCIHLSRGPSVPFCEGSLSFSRKARERQIHWHADPSAQEYQLAEMMLLSLDKAFPDTVPLWFQSFSL